MKGQSFLLAVAIALIALPAGAQQQPPDRLEKILHDGVLRVGTTMDTPVFSMRDPATGKLQGFDMDALEALGSALGVKIEHIGGLLLQNMTGKASGSPSGVTT